MNETLSAFINAGIAGAGVTIAVWLVLSIAPRRLLNAATRYALWWATLLVVVALPLFYLPHRNEPAAVPAATPPAVVETFAAATPVSDAAPAPAFIEPATTASRWQFPLEIHAGAWP